MSELMITSGVFCLELAVLALLFVRSRRPTRFGEVRLFPYRAAVIFMVLLVLATGAHLVSLITGTPLRARRPRGM